MNRTLLLFIVFLLLGGGVAWYMSQGEEDTKTTLSGTDRDFAVPDIDRVHKIFIADRLGEKSSLERQGDHWIYDGQYKASKPVMRPLLDAIKKMRIKYKPPQAAVDNIVNVLAAQGIKVELYDQENELIKSYYVGGGTSDERGTYGILEGAEQPYVLEIPAWEGNLSVRFRLKGDDWRSKLLFETPIENIRSVAIEYPKQKQHSFVLEQSESGEYSIAPFYELTQAMDGAVNEGKAQDFLHQFKSVSAESFRNQMAGRDSIRQLVPFSRITLVSTQGDTSQATLFPIIPEQVLTQDVKTGDYVMAGGGEIERYYVDTNSGDFMMAQHLVLKRVLKSYQSFFGQ